MVRLHSLLIGLGILVTLENTALALPPPDDVPEEILRTEVITEARSPLNGEPLAAADYAVLQDRLRDANTEAMVNPDLAQLVQLLQLRHILKPILPFIP
jgi:hypothetical protein